MTAYDLSSMIARNNVGEQQAIEGYMQLLAVPGIPQELADDIREIISDELNHTEKLNSWMIKLSGIVPAKT